MRRGIIFKKKSDPAACRGAAEKKKPERMRTNKSTPAPFLYTQPLLSWATDRGQRAVNQDALLILSAERGQRGSAPVLLAAVCDGMGGHAHGERASALAAAELERWFREWLSGASREEAGLETRIREGLRGAFGRIHRELRALAGDEGREMGTTAAVLVLCGDFYVAAHAGDSRIYAFSEAPPLITRDHSWVMEEVRAGRLREEETKMDPRRNILLRCLGIGEEQMPEIRLGKRRPGAAYLLCTDGFWREAGAETVREGLSKGAVRGEREAEALLRRGIEENRRLGERDNMTAVLLRDAAPAGRCVTGGGRHG